MWSPSTASELAPTHGAHASAFAAAKLVCKTLNQIMAARGMPKNEHFVKMHTFSGCAP